MIFNLLVILVLSIIITVFAVSNSGVVSVSLVFWQVQQVSLAIVILVSTLAGVIFAGILGVYQKMKDGIKIYRLEAKLREHEQEAAAAEDRTPRYPPIPS